MDWKRLYKSATPAERQEIVLLLFQRIDPSLSAQTPFVQSLPFPRARARIHWLGRADRPRRRERAMMTLLFLSAVTFLRPAQIAWWSTAVGGMTAIFLNLHAIYRAFPRKRYHWVR